MATERPDWQSVEELLADLAATGTTFSTAVSRSNRIASYERGRRLRVEREFSSNWVQIDSIRCCWETFERLGRIRRRDVLEPGRCSAFMMALFRQLPGVDEESGDETYLVLSRGRAPGRHVAGSRSLNRDPRGCAGS